MHLARINIVASKPVPKLSRDQGCAAIALDCLPDGFQAVL